jgi:hypothetical protein
MVDDTKTESGSLSLAEVLCEELNQVIPSRLDENGNPKHPDFEKIESDNLDFIFKQFHRYELSALCVSGGGIRSATFGLGVVQAMSDRDLLDDFDYISTVSGGGYLGSWLSAWIFRERMRKGLLDANPNVPHEVMKEKLDGVNLAEEAIGSTGLNDFDVDAVAANAGVAAVQTRLGGVATNTATDPNPEPTQLQHLREYSNYMSPRVGLLSADTWALIGIYVRNLFLNLTIFIPFMAAALLAPRFFYSIIRWNGIKNEAAVGILVASLLLGGYALSSVLSRLPSKNKDRDPDRNTDAWNFALAVLPLVLMALALSAVYVGTLSDSAGKENIVYAPGLELLVKLKELGDLPAFVISALLTCAVGYAIYGLWRRSGELRLEPKVIFATLLAAALWGALLWFLTPRIFDPELLKSALLDGSRSFLFPVYVCLSVPVFLLIFLIAATFFIGLSSGKVTDEDREWLARFGAWILIVCVVWMVLNALVLFGPVVIEALVSAAWGEAFEKLFAIAAAVIGMLSGAVSLIGGFSSRSDAVSEQKTTRSRSFLAFAPKLAAVIFLGFILTGIAYATSKIFNSQAVFTGGPEWLYVEGERSDHLSILAQTHIPLLLAWLVGLSAIGLFMAFFVNVNKFSLHGAYRDRLVRAYLGASNKYRKKNTFTGFDDADNFQLHRLKKQRPLHIINATLNLVGGTNLAWQNRKAASFTMSALHSGSWSLGYRHTNEYCRNKNLGACEDLTRCNRLDKGCMKDASGKPICELPGKSLRLGTAMAISGAAANPNMGYYSSSIVTFLMSLFNIRLGWWLGNTGKVGSQRDWFGRGPNRFFEKSSPSVAVLPLLNETLGRTDMQKKFLNVTDGGHFENLALYEMILRRCRLIVLSDGAADADFKFGEIANAIQKCKVDLGVDIKFLGSMNIRARKTREEGEIKRSRFAIAEIVYPERDARNKRVRGWLIYTRPTFYGTSEPRDIVTYADSNERFPHQSTGDQMYDEKQFEAYRGLGFLTMTEIQKVFLATANGDPNDEVDDELEDLFRRDADLRDTVFGFFGLGDSRTYVPRKNGPGR